MKRALPLIFGLIFVISSCEDLVLLHPVGGNPCVLLEGGTILQDEEAEKVTCHLGFTDYENQNGEYVLKCIGSLLPFRESCQWPPVDADCDGIPNDIFFPVGHPQNICPLIMDGVCKFSSYECIEGKMICVAPDQLYGPEICDRLDNQCNGLIDEDDPELVLSGPEYEYWGPNGTLNVGTCRAGHRECRYGEEILFGMIVPQEEICGNGYDENCDRFC